MIDRVIFGVAKAINLVSSTTQLVALTKKLIDEVRRREDNRLNEDAANEIKKTLDENVLEEGKVNGKANEEK